MNLPEVLVIATALALDCFAVALAAGTTITSGKLRVAASIAITFGIFQALMTAIGWVAGTWLTVFISAYDHWVAFILLAVIGLKMIREGVSGESEETRDYLSLPVLLVLAVATSLDALGVGLSFAVLSVPILIPATVIGVISLLLSFAGVFIGSRLAGRVGRPVEIFGGIVLLIIGIRILFEHLVV